MTATVDEATLQRIRAELEPLVDEYLTAHPEIIEQFSDAFAAAGPATEIAVATTETDPVEDDEDLSEAFAALFDEGEEIDAAEDNILDEALAAALDDLEDDDFGLADLFAEDSDAEEDEEEEDEAEPVTIDDALLEEIMTGDEPTAEQIALLQEAGITFEYEDD